jgi:hypothetical protein
MKLIDFIQPKSESFPKKYRLYSYFLGLSILLGVILISSYINGKLQYIKGLEIFIFFSTFLIILISGVGSYNIIKVKSNLDYEKRKSEKLLLNILPVNIIDELKNSGHSYPKYFESATVMFTDFVGFTQIAENLRPKELVDELDSCFSCFDSIMRK